MVITVSVVAWLLLALLLTRKVPRLGPGGATPTAPAGAGIPALWEACAVITSSTAPPNYAL